MKFIDFFAGIGGFRSGMTQAGHECVGFVEIDKFAVNSYKAVYETDGEYYANDITAVKPGDLPHAEVYCAGFPCQSFSIAGKRGGFEDTRGTLVFEVLRLAKDRKPKYLFFENVAGLLNHDGGRTFGTILCAMDELGYDAEWQCINSKNYVPQNRERAYIIGHLRGSGAREIFPITGENKTALKQLVGGSQGYRVYDPIGVSCTLQSQAGGVGAKTGLYMIDIAQEPQLTNEARCLMGSYAKNKERTGLYKRSGVLEVRPCLTPDRINKRQNGRRFKENYEPMFTLTSQDVHGILQLPRGKNNGGLHESTSPTITSNSFENNNLLLTAKTIRCGGTNSPPESKQNWDTYKINGKIRRLTPLECWRLQGFADEQFYKAQDVNSDSQLYKQAGNSVTVNVIYEIAKRLN